FKEIADKLYSHHINMIEPVNEKDSLFIGVNAGGKGNRQDMEKIMKWMKIDADFEKGADWIAFNAKADSVSIHYQTNTISMKNNIMPSVKGMGLRDALYVLENEGLTVNAIGKGKVVNQSIDQGQNIYDGMYVMIELK
ncbi:MAG: PASTA domain-containing protein, partial [Chitinophagales bacterium]|nr:PASTA domain-containing protein [Chitinophagales bacterium]